jgi:hypothetical protein
VAERPPEWTRRRPATTVCPTPRVSAPSARDRDPNWQPGDKWPAQWTNAVRVSVEEAATLQGFRLDYPWQGSRSRCFLQIGPPQHRPPGAPAMTAFGCPTAARAGVPTGVLTPVPAGVPTAVPAPAGREARQAACGLAMGRERFADLYPRRGSARE